jgi:hypothetical protein
MGAVFPSPIRTRSLTKQSIIRSLIHLTSDSNPNLPDEKWLNFQAWFDP